MGRIREQQIERLLMNPEHSEYCNCECPEGLSYSKLEETLNRVRMLHVAVKSLNPDDLEMLGCLECEDTGSGREYFVAYPCPTIKALEGSE